MSESAGRAAPRPASDDRGGPDEAPPFLGSWRRLYALVVLELLGIIAALYWLTRRFD